MITALIARLRSLAGDAAMQRMARDGFVSLAIKVASAGLTYTMFVALARAMGADDFGRYSAGFNAASLLAVVAGLGLHIGILRWWPEFEVKQELATAAHAARWSARLSLRASLLAALLMALAGMVIAAFTSDANRFIAVAALLVVPMCMAEYLGSILRAQGALGWALYPKDIIWRVAVCLFAGWAIWQGFALSDQIALAATALLLAPMLLAQWQRMQRALAAAPVANQQDKQLERSWRKSLVPIWASTVLYAAMIFGDVLIVGALLGAKASAFYFAVTRTASLLGLMLVASNMLGAPMISRHLHGGEPAQLQRFLRRNALLMGLPTLLGLLAIILFGKLILSLFGAGFEAAYLPLVILAAGQTIHTLAGPMSYMFHMSGHEALYLKITAGVYGIILLADLALIPTMGLTGAALAMLFGYLVWNGICRHYAMQLTGVDPTLLSLLPTRRLA